MAAASANDGKTVNRRAERSKNTAVADTPTTMARARDALGQRKSPQDDTNALAAQQSAEVMVRSHRGVELGVTVAMTPEIVAFCTCNVIAGRTVACTSYSVIFVLAWCKVAWEALQATRAGPLLG